MLTRKLFHKKAPKVLLSSITSLLLMFPLTSTTVRADDTEIYISAGSVANVLFVFDLSGSMNLPVQFGTPGSRYDALVDSMTKVLDTLKGNPSLRVGISLLGGDRRNSGTGIKWPVTAVDMDANNVDRSIRQNQFESHEMILNVLGSYSPVGGTPIVDAMYEAALYFSGSPITDGAARYNAVPEQWNGTRYIGTSTLFSLPDITPPNPAAYTPGNAYNAGTGTYSKTATYNSPITSECDANYVVLMSDGQPTSINTIGQAQQLTGLTCVRNGFNASGTCGAELASFMANTDLQAAAGITPSKVTTHTIGFAISNTGRTYLESLARAGGGNFYPAQNADQLQQSLQSILSTVVGENESFASLATSTNAGSLTSDNRVFINVFKPDSTRAWIGNTKGYFISSNGLVDLQGNPAVDATGQFFDTAQSFWSTGPDGKNVDQGGVSAKLNPATRRILTYTGPATGTSNATLTDISSANDPSLTPALFNAVDNAEKTRLIDFLKNQPMGDPLHSNVLKTSYSNRDVLFSMTNQGLLHIIDVTDPTRTGNTAGGTEIAAFIPQSLLPNIKDLEINESKPDNHIYGLDGTISYLHNDTDGDGNVSGNERAYIYFGMRRGGNQYFALDVTNPTRPRLAWRIDAGVGQFTSLGQSWSRMAPATINWNGADRDVLIFGGGYDPAVDGNPTRVTDSNGATRNGDSVGNAVYMVDARNGDLLWSLEGTGNASSTRLIDPAMRYSVPSDITVIDSSGDGLEDRLYFGDMGGQLWRVDFSGTLGGSNGSFAYRLADLSGNDAANFRRFFYPPSVAISQSNGSTSFAVAIGSGFRAHPLQTGVQDRFYVIRDTELVNATSAPNWPLITDSGSGGSSDLYKANSNVIGEGNNAQQQLARAELDGKRGWYLDLEGVGEKALAAPLIFRNTVFFPTYTPQQNVSACQSAAGSSVVYQVSLTDATPTEDINGDSTTTAADRVRPVPGIGIAPTPTVYFAPAGNSTSGAIFVGNNPTNNFNEVINRINWKEVE